MVSEVKYIKLDVNGLLDLDKLSQEYQISKTELIHFHNEHCAISELLPLDLPKYVPHIYLPKDHFNSKKLNLLVTNILSYPTSKSEKTYGVVVKYIHTDTQLHYEINVKRDHGFVEISKKKNYVNNAEVDNIIEKLYEAAEKTLYPLKVSVTGNGSLLRIENEKEILKRWENETLPQLKEYYVGSTSEEILGKMNLVFKNLNARRDFLLKSSFYKLFFLPVYQSYLGYKKEGNVDFYFAGIQQYISYDLDFLLKKEYTRGAKIALQITGNERDIIFNKKDKKGLVDLLYKFNKDSQELYSVTGFVSTFDNDKELRIEFQLFEIEK